MLSALVGANADRLRTDDGLAGALFETFVAMELERQAAWSPEPLSFWHYREGERNGSVARLQWPRPHPRAHRDSHGQRCVLYAGDRTLPFGDGLWAVPLRALWDG